MGLHNKLFKIPKFRNISFVGPRPALLNQYDLIALRTEAGVHELVPGMTGWAQINGRAELTTEPLEKLAYDLYYIENWSLIFDLKIMLRTITDVIQQKNVY